MFCQLEGVEAAKHDMVIKNKTDTLASEPRLTKSLPPVA
jgi:hypothetical protein